MARGEASDFREKLEFTIEPFVTGGFLLSVRYGGDGGSNVTGAGVWPTIEKVKEIAEKSSSRLLGVALVNWQGNSPRKRKFRERGHLSEMPTRRRSVWSASHAPRHFYLRRPVNACQSPVFLYSSIAASGSSARFLKPFRLALIS